MIEAKRAEVLFFGINNISLRITRKDPFLCILAHLRLNLKLAFLICCSVSLSVTF